jgi:hypothetical protein
LGWDLSSAGRRGTVVDVDASYGLVALYREPPRARDPGLVARRRGVVKETVARRFVGRGGVADLVVEVTRKGNGVHVVRRIDFAVNLCLLRLRSLLHKHRCRQQGDDKGGHHAPQRAGERLHRDCVLHRYLRGDSPRLLSLFMPLLSEPPRRREPLLIMGGGLGRKVSSLIFVLVRRLPKHP